MAAVCTVVVNSTNTNDVNDEKLEQFYSLEEGAAQLLDQGRTFDAVKKLSYQAALGKNSYYSGTHRIRIKLHYGCAFIGIRSHHIRVEMDPYLMAGQYHKTPSTYGWITRGLRIVNGDSDGCRTKMDEMEDVMIELTLHCDERRLSIVMGKTNFLRDEMDVDHLHAPFPWRLFVQLNRGGGRISLL
ncbi:unnamed protein product [Adineta steineri]|uniref:Uncharacterized protein n=1 Tax=Adineta steineri TaxID=433720 RepID=A0A819B3H5_9BILA|nr:unnamed protein product [Adineta steineri]CAF0866201.1 unnamed protein product [Adineta steineri]CAF3787633.1 unnamed protein product [Adineta steineri]CAF3982453.1 unnamed protein product [Adineta steineri]